MKQLKKHAIGFNTFPSVDGVISAKGLNLSQIILRYLDLLMKSVRVRSHLIILIL